jgi:hypothetical protein
MSLTLLLLLRLLLLLPRRLLLLRLRLLRLLLLLLLLLVVVVCHCCLPMVAVQTSCLVKGAILRHLAWDVVRPRASCRHCKTADKRHNQMSDKQP